MQNQPTEHRRAWDAIPWVVAGAADHDEQRWVHEHLPHCDECRAEWALQQRVHAGLAASLPTTLPDPGPAWQKLQARLDSTDSVLPTDLPAARADRAVPDHGRWTGWLVAAVLVQAIGLGAAGLAWLDHAPGHAGEGDFRTLSQPGPARAAVALRLVPAPAMDFAALSRLLADNGLVVVEFSADGRSLGLAAADGKPGSAAAALPVLRATPGVVLAEPVSSAP